MPSGSMSVRSVMIPVLLLGLPISLLAACDRQVTANEQASAPATPAAPVEASTIDRSHKGEAAPTVTFEAPDGKPATLDRFKGKPVLVNLWATWCGPCVKEMPTLDQVTAVQVATISQDKDRPTVAAFFDKRKFTRLQPYLDKNLMLSVTYNASLPMSILFDSTGHEVWRTSGGMDWTGAAAKAALAEAQ